MGRRKHKAGAAYADLTGKEVTFPLEAVPPRAQSALGAHGKILEGVVQGPDSVHPGCVVVKLRVKGASPGSQPLKLFFRADLVRSWLELPPAQPIDNNLADKRDGDADTEQRPSKKAKHTTPGAHALHHESCPTPIASTAELPILAFQANGADSDSTVHEAKHTVGPQQSVLANDVTSDLPVQRHASTEALHQELSNSFLAADVGARQMDGLEGPGLCANDAAPDLSHLAVPKHLLQIPVLQIPVQMCTCLPSTTTQFSSNLVRRYVLGEPANFQALGGTSINVPVLPVPQLQIWIPSQTETLSAPPKQATAAVNAIPQKGRFNILREALRQPTSTSAEHQVRPSTPAESENKPTFPDVSTCTAQIPDLPETQIVANVHEVKALEETKAEQQGTHIQHVPLQGADTVYLQPMAAVKSHKVCASGQPILPGMQQLPGDMHAGVGPQMVTRKRRNTIQETPHAQDTQQALLDINAQQLARNDALEAGEGLESAHQTAPIEGNTSRAATHDVTKQAVKWGKPTKGRTKKQQVADIQGKVFYIPGPVFGVDVPDFYYRAKVIGPDKGHKNAAVITLLGQNLKNRFFFPIGQVREWIANCDSHAHDSTTGLKSDEFAAEVLAAMQAGLDPSESNSIMSHSCEGSDPLLQRHASVGTK